MFHSQNKMVGVPFSGLSHVAALIANCRKRIKTGILFMQLISTCNFYFYQLNIYDHPWPYIYIELAESSAPQIEDTLQSTKLYPSRIYKQYKQLQIGMLSFFKLKCVGQWGMRHRNNYKNDIYMVGKDRGCFPC